MTPASSSLATYTLLPLDSEVRRKRSRTTLLDYGRLGVPCHGRWAYSCATCLPYHLSLLSRHLRLTLIFSHLYPRFVASFPLALSLIRCLCRSRFGKSDHTVPPRVLCMFRGKLLS